MIFKTIDADATNLTKKMGLLGKSFNDIKKDYSNGLGITKSLFSTSISESDWKSLQKFNSAIKVTNDGLTKSQRITKAWNENMTGCSIAAKRMGNDLVTGKKKISDVSSAMKTATASTKALEIAMNVFANVGFMLAITAVTKVISELAQAQSNAVETAKEATSAYNDELSSIKDYKEKISELNEELDSGNLSYEETKTKRSELMSIQDELIEKFGTEKSAIESVTEAIGGQVDALDNLNEKSYRDWIAKADDKTIWTSLLPWGKSGLDQAIDYMESKKTISFSDMANANSTTQDKYQAPITDEIRSIQEEIDKTIQSKYNLEKKFATFKITGTPEEVKSQLEAIRQDYLDLSKDAFLKNGISSEYWDAYRSEAINSINDIINQFDEGLKKHQETYKTYIEGMIKYDSEYSDEYATILRKRAELEDAENSGDVEKIQKARQEFMDAIASGITASESDENIKKYFESLYPELQAEFANWNFEIAINANTDNLKDEAEEIGKQYSATDLLDMINTEGVQEGEEAFNKLINKAIEYGVCTDNSSEEVQKLIDLLVELGIVQGNIESDVQHETPISDEELKQLTDNVNTAFETIEKSYKAYNDFKTALANNSIDNSVLSSVAALSDELSNLVAGYYAGVVSSDELYNALSEHYATDTKNYADALIAKNSTSESFYNNLLKADTNLVNDLMNDYGIDISNCKNYAEAKLAIEKQTLETVSAMWSKYYDAQTKSFTKDMETLGRQAEVLAKQGVSDSDNQYLQLAQQLGTQVTAYEEAMLRLDDIVYKGIPSSFENNYKTWDANKAAKSASDAADKAAEEAEKAAEELAQKTKELVDSYMEYMDKSLDAGKIDYHTYCYQVKNYLDDMYRQGKITAEDYFSFIQKMLEKQSSIYDKALSGVINYLDTVINTWNEQINIIEDTNDKLNNTKDYYDSVLSAISALLDDEIQKWQDKIDLINEENDALNDQKDTYDSVISAVTTLLDKESDSIQDQIDLINEKNDAIQDQIDKYDSILSAVDDVYDNEIDQLNAQKDALQEQIDALNDKNDAVDLQYRKEKALYALEQAQQQRNRKVYTEESGYIYDTDFEAVRDAKKDLSDIQNEELIDSLKKEQDAIDDSIDNLQKYKDMWDDIAGSYEKAANAQAAMDYFGSDYINKILSSNAYDIGNFQTKYNSQKKDLEANNDYLDKLQEQLDKYNNIKDNWSNVSSNYEEEKNNSLANDVLGKDWQDKVLNDTFDLNDFTKKYNDILSKIDSNNDQIDSINEKIDGYNKIKDQWSSITDELEKEQNKQNAMMMFGFDWEQKILSGRLEEVTKFKDKYLKVQSEINSNEELINSYQSRVDYYERLKSQWQDLTSEYEKQSNAQYTAQILGADWEEKVLNGRLDTMNAFKDEYLSIQKEITEAAYNMAEAQKKAAEEAVEEAKAAAAAVGSSVPNTSTPSNNTSSGSSTNSSNSSTKTRTSSTDETPNTQTSTPKYKVVDENGKTLITYKGEDAKNKAEKYKSGLDDQAHDLSKVKVQKCDLGGVVKINPNDILTDLAKKHGEDGFIMARNGERVLTEHQNEGFEKGVVLFERFSDMLKNSNFMPNIFTSDLAKAAQNITNNNQPTYTVTMGDIHLHEVQNADQLGDAIVKRLPGIMRQKLSARK